MNTHLYGLTVQGIQPYIFSTNKLKEIIGASEIIEKLCTQWFEEFITEKTIEGTKLLNAAGNIRFLTTEQNAKKIYRDFPFFLKDKAVGVPYSQAVVENNNNDVIYNLDVRLRAQRNIPIQDFDLGIMVRNKERRTGEALYQKMPVTNGKYGEFLNFGKTNFAKRKNSKSLYADGENEPDIKLTEKTKITANNINYSYPNEFETIAKNGKDSWLALVHIDGNGMGNIIKSIISKSDKPFKDLAEFSENVEKSTLEAYKKSVEDIIVPNAIIEKEDSVEEHILPFRPIVLGGDDLTVIMRADLAIAFVKSYLENFEEETKNNLKQSLTACAGVAFVKEKFPFHYSSTLAEDLCKHAKNKSNRAFSCLSFYRVQDSFINSYEEIVERELKNSKVFNETPYTIINKEDFKTINSLLNDINSLKNEDAPTGTIRKKVDAYLNGFINDEELKAPLKNYDKNLAEKSNYFIDYLTLLAVGTKN